MAVPALMTQKATRRKRITRCSASGSTRRALSLAVDAILEEYSPVLPESPLSLPLFRGSTCVQLRAEVDDVKGRLLSMVKGEVHRISLLQALRSLSRFFDGQCKPCDKTLQGCARKKWYSARSEPVPAPGRASWSDDPIGELVRVILRDLGPDWGRKLPRLRAFCRVPDSNGCLETSRRKGGTLGTNPSCHERVWNLRLGVAKTKGKHRCVTLQSAYVKDVLDPVHECLYDSISVRRWCVRGEFSKTHARILVDDLRPGEGYFSGDFSSATDNFHPELVFRLVSALAESPYLQESEREAMVESFRPENLMVQDGVCRSSEQRRAYLGQMMGSKLSFPLLCLINRGLFLIACRLWGRALGQTDRRRKVLINGDDIAFCADDLFRVIWRGVVEHFGMVVNLEKSGFSSRFLELNSKTFDCKRGRFVRKPVLSGFIRDSTPGCILSRLLEGLKGFSSRVCWRAIIAVRNLVRRTSVCLQTIPHSWRKPLLKERWFRQALSVVPVVVSTGRERAWRQVVKDEMPDPSLLPLYEEIHDLANRVGVDFLRGLPLPPFEQRLRKQVSTEVCRCGSATCDQECPVRKNTPVFLSSCRISLSKSRWAWVWSLPVWTVWDAYNLPLRNCRELSQWADDHDHLVVKRDVVYRCSIPPPSSISPPVGQLGFKPQSLSPALPGFVRPWRPPAPYGRPEGGGAWLRSLWGGKEERLGDGLRDAVQYWRLGKRMTPAGPAGLEA
jgi:hypothetical protein